MYIPASTYRLQANSNFTLSHIKGIVDYLDQLGITTIYCAPFFQSRCGSTHGYDVTNPHVLNPELGQVEELREIAVALAQRHMGWLQDIVPNHMAYDCSNVWLVDIFEKGKHSDYANFFDIDWKNKEESLSGKVIFPFLSESLENTLAKKQIKVEYHQQGFVMVYNGFSYPMSWASYYAILSAGQDMPQEVNDEHREHWKTYRQIIEEFKTIRDQFDVDTIANTALHHKETLYELYRNDKEVKDNIDQTIAGINADAITLQEILEQQHVVWTTGNHTDNNINYRRFFIVNELICLRMEQPEVFSHYHQFLKTLLNERLIQGLRVDHIDGLADPGGYLMALRQLTGEDCYLIVEKILEFEEQLPAHWPIQGTSGYEFLSVINHLFTKQESKDKLTETYRRFTGLEEDYEDMVFDRKFFILTHHMNGELDNLLQQILRIHKLAEQDTEAIRNALSVFMACFSIYRTYIQKLPVANEDTLALAKAFERAEKRRPDLRPEFQLLRSVLHIKEEDPSREEKLKVVIRLQQFTGPLAAKGVEDTVFYVYNRLISHNEVGDSPKLFGITVDQFHATMKERLTSTPLSINATSTHDTKRGEDARLRINVLSEIPEAWASMADKWKSICLPHKQLLNGIHIPDANDEYFIYQSLIGGFPSEGKSNESFLQRFKDFMRKALREGRTNSDWSKPNDVYEQATHLFIERILQDNNFMESFLPFFHQVNHYGMILSLSQTLIKITAPGIPDTYQGTELWDLSFVDPDNRRTVDFEQRKVALAELLNQGYNDKAKYLSELMHQANDGRIKLYTTWAALNERKHRQALFQSGEYLPLAFSGVNSECLVGFARKLDNEWSITIAPKEVKALGAGHVYPLGIETWEDTVVILPATAPDEWTNAFTHERYVAAHYTLEEKDPETSDAPIDAAVANRILIGKKLNLSQVLEQFPIALLRH